MDIYTSSLKLPGGLLEGENPLPAFRSSESDVFVESVSGSSQLQREDFLGLGKHAGVRILPYKIQDRYSRERKTVELKTVVLENNILQATFLLDYGARLYSLYHKTQERELLFCNPVHQLANLSIRNAWFSGGIEWNVSQYGHTFSTCSPLFAAVCTADKDVHKTTAHKFLRFYNFERCKELFWQMDFHLLQNSETLHMYVKVLNPKDYAESMYWWTNIAVPEEKRVRVFSEDSRIVYMAPELRRGFGQANLPNLPCLRSKDASFPQNFQHSSEYFFQNDSEPISPWEIAAYDDGNFFFERSTSKLRYRKMFCWGTHIGGQRWKDFLSEPSKGNYLEIQAGLAPTQLHGIEIPARTSWDFVQVFGGSCSKQPELFYSQDWQKSANYAKEMLETIISTEDIENLYADYQGLAELQPTTLLHSGEAWAALEAKRGGYRIPDAMNFPSDLAVEESDWLHLLEHGYLSEPEGTVLEVSWIVSPAWLILLENSCSHMKGSHWYSHLQLGVCYYENCMHEEALAEWHKSLGYKENPLAYRNIAYHFWKTDVLERAVKFYKKIFSCSFPSLDRAYAEEYLEILLEMNKYQDVWDFFIEDQVENPGRYRPSRLALLVGRAAVELGQDAYIEELLAWEYPQLREGENFLLDIWYIQQAKVKAEQEGIPVSEELRAKLLEEAIPPMEIDFRMGAYKSFDKKL